MTTPINTDALSNALQMFTIEGMKQSIIDNAEALTEFTRQQFRNAADVVQSPQRVVGQMAQAAHNQVIALNERVALGDANNRLAHEGIERSARIIRETSDQCSTSRDQSASLVPKDLVSRPAKAAKKAKRLC